MSQKFHELKHTKEKYEEEKNNNNSEPNRMAESSFAQPK